MPTAIPPIPGYQVDTPPKPYNGDARGEWNGGGGSAGAPNGWNGGGGGDGGVNFDDITKRFNDLKNN